MKRIAVLLAAVAVAVPACSRDGRVALPRVTPSPSPSASASPTPSPSVSPSPAATRSPSRRATRPPSPAASRTPSRSPSPSPRPRPVRSLAVFRGLGTWVDAYDYAEEYGGALTPDAVDEMAAAGVRTLYLQAAREHARSPGLLLSPDLLERWVARAHARGIAVVGWYLPTFTDPARDWAHLDAMLRFRAGGRGFDAIGVDIESRDLADVDQRNERLVALSKRLRAAAPALPLQAIVLPPVVTDVISPAYWPRFPWRAIAPSYDVWSPMGYWTNRTQESGWRNAERYTAENVRMTRENLGRPTAPVHPIGGIGDQTTAADITGFTRAAHATGSLGGSLYDYATTRPGAWPGLRGVPR